jgi:protein required for attachment to host cells
MKRQTWILVANAERARLFSSDGRGLLESSDAIHLESAAHGHDLITDSAGRRGQGPAGRGDRPGLGGEEPRRKLEAERFARQLAALLKTGLDDHACEGLVLVAPPHFLGLLKKHLGHTVARRVDATLDRDLVLKDVADLEGWIHALA